MIATGAKERKEKIKKIRSEIIDSATKKIAEDVIKFSAHEKNLAFNDIEYASKRINMQSTPEGVGIGAHYNCNAKCIFCLGGKPKLFTLQRYKEFFEPKLGAVLSNARYVNFCGYGELLLMPQVEEFLEYVNTTIPQVNKLYTSNGVSLANERVLFLLTESKSVVEISLHASNRELHKLLMRMDTFDLVVSKIKKLIAMRKKKDRPTVCAVFLLNTLNIENLPDFVKFAADLGVDEIICNYMVIFKQAQLKLSCFFKQDITNASFDKALEQAAKMNIPIRLPPRFKTVYPLESGNFCSDPWKYFYVENEGSVLPCCNAGYHFGYLDKSDFQTIWNGFGYKNLRSSFLEGKPHRWCTHCVRFDRNNVNDIRSHISFRPNVEIKF